LDIEQLTSALAPRAPTKFDLEKNSIEKRIIAGNTVRIALRVAQYL
jgi:hypothetical protein